jgi:phytoene/squalene synthetase
MTKAGVMKDSPSGRELAAFFAPGAARQRLAVLYGWVLEIEEIASKAKEPAIRAMRFAWHRDAVDDLYAVPQKIRRHAAYEGLAGLIGDAAIAQRDLISIIDAVEAGLDPERLTNASALLAIIDAHSGSVTGLAAQICDAGDHELVALAGRVIGLDSWVREFAMRAGCQFALVPASDLQSVEFNIHRLATGREAEIAHRAFAPTLDCFAQHVADIRKAGPCPTALFPALGAARLARATLRKAIGASDLYRTDFARSQMARQFDLVRASLSGRL